MIDQVRAAEERVESQFRRGATGGGIPNQVYSTVAGDLGSAVYFDGADSALFTGVYLASQCVKLAVSTDPYDRETALVRVRSLLDTAEFYHRVTGVRGLIARYAYRKGATDFALQEKDESGKARKCSGTLDWAPGGPGYENFRFCGLTSRDQYHGFLVGLAACHSWVGISEVKSRSARLASELVDAIDSAGWKIPYGRYEPIWGAFDARVITSNARLAFAQLGVSVIPTLKMGASAAEQQRLAGLEQRLKRVVDTEYERVPSRSVIEQSWWNNYSEYYAHHLSALSFLILARVESDPDRLAMLRHYFWNQTWLTTWDHQNAQFSYTARLLLGPNYTAPVPRGKRTPQAALTIAEARESLRSLLLRRRDDSMGAATRADCELDPFSGQTLLFLTELVKKVPIPVIKNELTHWGKIQRRKCVQVLPLAQRGYEHYYWERNPYSLVEGHGEGRVSSPGVDAIFAYWLGRAAGSIGGSE